ncbi:MAG: hypothetical protein PPP58_09160 [Natronomonas sp.]
MVRDSSFSKRSGITGKRSASGAAKAGAKIGAAIGSKKGPVAAGVASGFGGAIGYLVGASVDGISPIPDGGRIEGSDVDSIAIDPEVPSRGADDSGRDAVEIEVIEE